VPLPEPAPAKGKGPDYRPLYAVFGALLVLAVLVTPVEVFKSNGSVFTATELRGRPASTMLDVQLAPYLRESEGVQGVPKHIGAWNMSRQYNWDPYQQILDADALVSRDYRAPGMNAPASLVVLQSTNMSSFHSPRVCYEMQRFTILEEHTGKVKVPLKSGKSNTTGFVTAEGLEIDAQRYVVERTIAQGVTLRMLDLHFFVREESGYVTQRATWIRTSMYIPPGHDMADYEPILIAFMGEAVPEMVNVSPAYQRETVLEYLLSKVL